MVVHLLPEPDVQLGTGGQDHDEGVTGAVASHRGGASLPAACLVVREWLDPAGRRDGRLNFGYSPAPPLRPMMRLRSCTKCRNTPPVGWVDLHKRPG